MELIEEFNNLEWEEINNENLEKHEMGIVCENETILKVLLINQQTRKLIYFTDKKIILAKYNIISGLSYWEKAVIRYDDLIYYSTKDTLNIMIINSELILLFKNIGEIRIKNSRPIDYTNSKPFKEIEELITDKCFKLASI